MQISQSQLIIIHRNDLNSTNRILGFEHKVFSAYFLKLNWFWFWNEFQAVTFKSDKCVMCNEPLGITEDQNHMWKCSKTI